MPLAVAVNVTFVPIMAVWLCGCSVIDGETQTVNMATPLVIEPAALLATTLYVPPSEVWTPLSWSVAKVAPLIGFPLNCHWYPGAGVPDALVVKRAVVPTTFVRLCGCSVIEGETQTVSVATALVIEPAALLATTVYAPPSEVWTPLSCSVAKVAPLIGLPLNCH